ncbi:MAG: hypothetical protein J3K34DRAFT_416678 [Monoraphidium minutum]|nr:MAG: hypothetical protein J3K34DRAFT_416678 [Monoraphidium minutum]
MPSTAAAAPAAAALMLALLLAAAAPRPAAGATFRATVSSCAELQAKLQEYGDRMARATVVHRYRLRLACPADGARYDDCAKPPQTGAAVPSLVRLQGKGRVEIKPSSSKCSTGAARPRLSGNTTEAARFFFVTGAGAALTLDSLVLDGLGLRPGIFAEGAERLALKNVDLLNFQAHICDVDNNAYKYERGCGGALATYGTRTDVAGGAMEGNAASYFGFGNGFGGAVFAEVGTVAPGSPKDYSGPILTIKGTVFKGNAATFGGAIYVRKASPKAATVTCTGCTFEANLGNCSAIASERNDYERIGGQAGAPLRLNLGSGSKASTFKGNAGPASGADAVCGSAQLNGDGAFTPSKVPDEAAGLSKAAAEGRYNDFIFTQQP